MKPRDSYPLTALFLLAFILGALAVASVGDEKAQKVDDALFCRKVRANEWPDPTGDYSRRCPTAPAK